MNFGHDVLQKHVCIVPLIPLLKLTVVERDVSKIWLIVIEPHVNKANILT